MPTQDSYINWVSVLEIYLGRGYECHEDLECQLDLSAIMELWLFGTFLPLVKNFVLAVVVLA